MFSNLNKRMKSLFYKQEKKAIFLPKQKKNTKKKTKAKTKTNVKAIKASASEMI